MSRQEDVDHQNRDQAKRDQDPDWLRSRSESLRQFRRANYQGNKTTQGQHHYRRADGGDGVCQIEGNGFGGFRERAGQIRTASIAVRKTERVFGAAGRTKHDSES